MEKQKNTVTINVDVETYILNSHREASGFVGNVSLNCTCGGYNYAFGEFSTRKGNLSCPLCKSRGSYSA